MSGRSTTLLLVFLGVAFAFGSLVVGLVVVRSSLGCMVARQYLCQLSALGCGVATLLYTPARGFYAAGLYSWMYGLFCGAYQYSLKVHSCEQVTLKIAERAWGYILLAQALPTFIGPPLASEWENMRYIFVWLCGSVWRGTLCRHKLHVQLYVKKTIKISFECQHP